MRTIIVDDSRFIRTTIHDIVKKNFADMECVEAENGSMALGLLDVDVPQIMLLDIMMPGMNGMDVLRAVEPLTSEGTLKVIMISSIDDEKVLTECFHLGSDDFIRKPVSETELTARLEGAAKVLRLVTDLRETRQTLMRNNQELAVLNQKLLQTKNQMVQSEKLAGIGQLAAGVAHEINNPVGFIASNLTMLKDYVGTLTHSLDQCLEHNRHAGMSEEDLFGAKQANDIHVVLEDLPVLFEDTEIGIGRIKEIVNSLRSFSRVDQSASFELFDVNQGVRDALIVSRNRYRYVAVVKTAFGDLPMILAHGGKLNQVFMNLIMNAADAITERRKTEEKMGCIEIATYICDNRIHVEVTDDGTGIEEEVAREIFNPFFTTKPVGSGTGLGLSVSYDIVVNEHRGDIRVRSRMGQGTTFTVALPMDLQDPADDAAMHPVETAAMHPVETAAMHPVETAAMHPVETAAMHPVETAAMHPVEAVAMHLADTDASAGRVSQDWRRE